MFKTEIKFTDFVGNEKTATLRFNLTEDELMDLIKADPMFSTDYLGYIVAEQNLMMMLDVIKKIIRVSYGLLSEDGNYFRKPKEAVEDFMQSAMYYALLEKLTATDDAEYLKSFIMGVFPAKFAEELAKLSAEQTAETASVVPITFAT